MTFDLGAAMRKKEEFESARLLDFAFCRRARATRLLALRFDLDPAWLIDEMVKIDEAALARLVADLTSLEQSEVLAAYQQCESEAHAQLLSERGDPTPHRLA